MIDDPSDERIDLSALAARDDRALLDAAVAAIVRDGLAARRRDVPFFLAQWLPRTLAAAVVLAAALLPMIVRRTPSTQQGSAAPAASSAEILGVPRPLIDLVASTPQPSLDELARALDADASDAGGANVR